MSAYTSDAPTPRDAFTEEVTPHIPLLSRAALRLTHDEQAAEDLLQDTLERGFMYFSHYRPDTNVRAWLLHIMRNVRITAYRSAARRPDHDLARSAR